MSKTNERFRVPLPEAGENAYLDFDIAAMDELHDFFGDEYVQRISTGVDRRNIAVLRKALGTMMRDANLEPEELLAKIPLAEIGEKINDVMVRRIYGKSVAEFASTSTS